MARRRIGADRAYVLVHELTHLLARNHDERFLALMDRHLPTWRRRRTEFNAALRQLHTVETHHARILRKLDGHSLADLLRFAARHRLLPD